MNEWSKNTCAATYKWVIIFQGNKKMNAFYFTLKVIQFCLWIDTCTAVFVKRAVPSILTFRCISLLWLREFIQTPYFALYNVTFPSFLGVWSCQMFFVCGWFSMQGIEKDGWDEVRGIDVVELHSSSICQTVLWNHFISASGCIKRVVRFFSQNFCEDLTNYLLFTTHSKLMKHNSYPESFWNPWFMKWVNIEINFI
jgi:hypothetical protein